MSLVTLKNKVAAKNGGRRSVPSKATPGRHWFPHGPFGACTASSVMLDHAIHRAGRDGFSINGGRRSTGYIGKTSHMSRAGTPFNGLYAKGHGGKHGKYFTPPLGHYVSQKNAMVETRGTQGENVCPSVISIGSMVRKKYSGAAHNVVRSLAPENPNPADYSHGMYLHTKRAQNICVTANLMAHANDTRLNKCFYTKTLAEPIDGHEYVTRVRKSCATPVQN